MEYARIRLVTRVSYRKIGLSALNVGRWPVDAWKIGLFTQALAAADPADGAIWERWSWYGILDKLAKVRAGRLSSKPLSGASD